MRKKMQGKNSAMAEPVLKFPPEQKGAPGQPPREKLAAAPRRRLLAAMRRYRRFLLLVVLPIVAVIGGVALYLNGGRYVGTDDTYVGAQKVLITPDISGRIDKVVVKEGQLVHRGDVLFEIDPIPFRLAVDRAKAAVEQARTTYSNLGANIKIYDEMADLMQQTIDLKERDVNRKSTLAKNSYGSQLDLDNSSTASLTARVELAFVQQQRSSSLTQLLGNPNLALEDFPPYYQAQAMLAQAQRDLDHTEMRAPMDGIATLVDQIQLGRFVVAGSPVFTVIDVAKPWIDSNLKESDLTHLEVGQPVEIDVDAFPDHTFKGVVGSLSPGTGAQFAILPPQNATGNFVKVVQRVPVRIYFDQNDPFVKKLKAGMSAYATIDTGHKRTLAALFGLRSATAKQD
jgi:membrane fusion protein, multidrug efflux system